MNYLKSITITLTEEELYEIVEKWLKRMGFRDLVEGMCHGFGDGDRDFNWSGNDVEVKG